MGKISGKQVLFYAKNQQIDSAIIQHYENCTGVQHIVTMFQWENGEEINTKAFQKTTYGRMLRSSENQIIG